MNTTGYTAVEAGNPAQRRPAFLDSYASGLILLAAALAALYPETFISGDFSIGSQRLTPLTLLLPAMAASAIIYVSARHNLIKPRLADLALAGFMIWLIVRNPWGYPAAVALKYIILGLSIYYITALLMQTRHFPRMLILSLPVLVCVIALYGFIEFVLQRNMLFGSLISESVREPLGHLRRAGSTFAHPVSYGAFLVQMLPFCALVAFGNGKRRETTLGTFALVMAAVALFLTFSKGSMLVAALIGAAALSLLVWRMGGKTIVIILMTIFFVAAMIFTFEQELSGELAWRGTDSANMRLISWEGTLEAAREHPLAGVGLRNGPGAMADELIADGRPESAREIPIDNFYLTTLVEAGAVGLLLWLLFLFTAFRDGIGTVLRGAATHRGLTAAALVSMAGLCLNAFSFDAFLMYGNFVFFWLAAGVVRGAAAAGTVRSRSSRQAAHSQIDNLMEEATPDHRK